MALPKIQTPVFDLKLPSTGEEIKYTSNNVNYDTFKSFAVKAIMTSNNATVVPKVRDIRIIALD